jgi:hypothetical protein
LFTNPDFTSEVGMPWEIDLQYLTGSGRFTKIFKKEGDVGFFHSEMTINRALGFSVISFFALYLTARLSYLLRLQFKLLMTSHKQQIPSLHRFLNHQS